MIRHRLKDEQWERIKDVFGPPARTGRPPRHPRQVIDAILWVLNTGAPWRDLPAELGPWQTVWHRYNQWNGDGTLDAILTELIGEIEINQELWCIDGTVVRAAKCAAGGGKNDEDEPADHAPPGVGPKPRRFDYENPPVV